MKNIIKKSILAFVFFGIFSSGVGIALAGTSPSITSGSASSITTNSATLNGVVNPNGDDTTVWFETTSGGPYQIQSIGNGTTDVPLLSYNLTGLTSNTTYTFKIMAGNTNGSIDSGFVFSFTTSPDPILPSPTIASKTATSITSTSATLNGSINPNGYATTAWFETPDGGPFQTQTLGNGNAAIPMLSYNLTGLIPSTTYTFKIKAGNANGTVDSGWVSFTTSVAPTLPSPTIVSNTATGITTISANLNGIINPKGYTTTAWFETPDGGPFQTQNLGNANSNVTMLSYSLTGLNPSTTYTFKIKAGNANGTVDSGWISFTTSGVPALPKPTIVSGSAINITTTSADLSGIINPNGYTTTAFFETPSNTNLQTQNLGNGSSNVNMLTYSLTGLTPSTTYTFRISANNANGTSTNGWISFTTASSGGGCTLPTIGTLSPSSVTEGAGATTVTITGTNFINGTSSALFNGTARTTTFINTISLTINLTAADVLNAGTGNITVSNGACVSGSSTFTINASTTTGGGGGGGSSAVFATVITQNATNTTENFAKLNGSINPNGYTTTAWFEYGTSSTLSAPTETTHTAEGSGNSPIILTQNLINLTPNTTYYFRVIANNQSGTNKGIILSFKTSNTTVTPTTPTASVVTTPITSTPITITKPNTTTPVKNTNSSNVVVDYSKIGTAKLEILNTESNVSVGDEVIYSITFKNLISKNLENIKMSVHLPKEIDFKESNIGTLENDNTVVLNFGTLYPNDTNTLIVKGVVNKNASLQNIIITTASVSYNVSGSSLIKKETSYITNYVVNKIKGLEANSLFSMTYIPYWIALIAIILVILGLIVIGKRLRKNKF